MKIKFIVDFRGRETNEQFYQSGQEVDLEDSIANRLVQDGRAEVIETKEEPKRSASKKKQE